MGKSYNKFCIKFLPFWRENCIETILAEIVFMLNVMYLYKVEPLLMDTLAPSNFAVFYCYTEVVLFQISE